jgi:transposase InsO family protein
MGVTIQFESHKNELAFIKIYEEDDDVLEYYDQPSTIKLAYEAANGRHLGVLHTPDFFVIRANSAGWEECKNEGQLIQLALSSPNRYVQDGDNGWRCLPGESYAADLGLYYRIRSSKEINWTYQRNLEFLEDFYRSNVPMVINEIRTAVLTKVTETPGITLESLFENTKKIAKHDEIFTLIAVRELYVNLQSALLIEQNKVRVYLNQEMATAYEELLQLPPPTRLVVPRFVELKVGTSIRWNSTGWTIANVGETEVSLISADKEILEIPIATFLKLIQEDRIIGLDPISASSIHPEIERRILQADKRALGEANYRCKIVRAYLSQEFLPEKLNCSKRTIRRWLARYRKFQDTYGNGYAALLPSPRSGNTKNKLPASSRSLICEFIENDYETIKQKRKSTVYGSYRLKCERSGVLPASYKTFIKAINCRPRYNQTFKRLGSKAAYKEKEFYWEINPTTPRHGEWPLHIAHIDHTELDAELLCSLTGRNLGRAWATYLTDAYSRRLAVHITYDPPSYRSNMMIMRECVRRFGRLPQIIIVDGGKDFFSTYFETLLARYECTKKVRPPSESRFGSISERLFGTSNSQFIHNLQGNTQIMRNIRQITQYNNPKKNALWTLEKIFLYLHNWAYEVYDTIEHPALGQSPRDAFTSGMIRAGERAHRLIAYNEEFKIFTLPTTAKGTAKVSPGRGVKINRLYYWSDTFRHPEVEGAQVSVRFDPFNAGSSFAYVRGQWTECRSEHWSTFRGRSERELMIATEELRRRHTLHSRQFNITAVKLAHFLQSVEAEEVLLQQRLADRAAQNMLTIIDGGLQAQSSGTGSQSTTLEATTSYKNSTSHSSSKDTTKDDDLETYGEF